MDKFPYRPEPSHYQGDPSIAPAQRSTATLADQNNIIRDVNDKIFLLDADSHPLLTFLTNVGKSFDGKAYKGMGMLKKVALTPTFEWFEDSFGGKMATVNADYDDDDTTLTVTGAGTNSAYIFTKGDVIFNARTNERMKVASVASGSTITVVRSIGATAAVAGLVNDNLYIIGNANPEGGLVRNQNTTKIVPNSNYTQIFRTTVGATRTAMKTNTYGGNDFDYQKRKKAVDHVKAIEDAFVWGEKGIAVSSDNGQPERYTGGVMEFVTAGNSYVQDQNNLLTSPDLDVFIREASTYTNGATRKFLAGNIIISAVNEIAKGQIQTKTGDTTYGVSISKWMSSFGDIELTVLPSFRGEDFAGYGLLLDINNFAYRFIQDSDTQLQMNVQANGADGRIDQWLTECGLERREAEKAALIKRVTE